MKNTIRIVPWALLLLVILVLPSCLNGLVYTNIVEPLDLNHSATDVGTMQEREGSIKHFKYSMLDLSWDSNGIADVAQRNGLNEVYYADMETLSILGIWNQYTVHVYGR